MSRLDVQRSLETDSVDVSIGRIPVIPHASGNGRDGQIPVIARRRGERVNRPEERYLAGGLCHVRVEPRCALKGHIKGNQSLAALDSDAESTENVPFFRECHKARQNN